MEGLSPKVCLCVKCVIQCQPELQEAYASPVSPPVYERDCPSVAYRLQEDENGIDSLSQLLECYGDDHYSWQVVLLAFTKILLIELISRTLVKE